MIWAYNAYVSSVGFDDGVAYHADNKSDPDIWYMEVNSSGSVASWGNNGA